MEKKRAKFDPESAFKSIVGLNDSIEEETKEETPRKKKSDVHDLARSARKLLLLLYILVPTMT